MEEETEMDASSSRVSLHDRYNLPNGGVSCPCTELSGDRYRLLTFLSSIVSKEVV